MLDRSNGLAQYESQQYQVSRHGPNVLLKEAHFHRQGLYKWKTNPEDLL